jgi:hypothetical protein
MLHLDSERGRGVRGCPVRLSGDRSTASNGCLIVLIVAVAVVVALLLLRWGATVALLLALVILLLLALVTGIAKGVATQGSEAGTDGSAFEATSALVADDATNGRAAQCTKHGTGLSVRTRSTGDQ